MQATATAATLETIQADLRKYRSERNRLTGGIINAQKKGDQGKFLKLARDRDGVIAKVDALVSMENELLKGVIN